MKSNPFISTFRSKALHAPSPIFSDVERDNDTGLSRLSVTVKGETFCAVHRNKKSCKRVLALRILDKIAASEDSGNDKDAENLCD